MTFRLDLPSGSSEDTINIITNQHRTPSHNGKVNYHKQQWGSNDSYIELPGMPILGVTLPGHRLHSVQGIKSSYFLRYF